MHRTDLDVQRMLDYCGGDGSAFDALFDRWAEPLLHFLERMVHDTATAEELVQEAFLRVHRARERYRPEAKFSTWLYRIGTNLALNELRRPRRRNPHTDSDAPALHLVSDSDAPDDRLETRRRATWVETELANLPERQRAALWLTAVDGMSYVEVASVLDTTEKSIKALVHRARSSLAQRMGNAEAKRPGPPHAEPQNETGAK